MKPAVFLDRDGTINVDVGYLHKVADLELFPFAADALRLLKRAGYALVVVTNQSGIARGFIQDGVVEAIHEEMQRRLAPAGAAIDRYYYCPHDPKAERAELQVTCACRKPRPGMIEDAVRELHLDPGRSWVVGDKWSDVQLGAAVGARSILVRTGWGTESERARPAGQPVDAVCDNLMAAAGWILSQPPAAG